MDVESRVQGLYTSPFPLTRTTACHIDGPACLQDRLTVNPTHVDKFLMIPVTRINTNKSISKALVRASWEAKKIVCIHCFLLHRSLQTYEAVKC